MPVTHMPSPTETDDLNRLMLSRQTLLLYERNGLPGGRVEANLRVLADEIIILRNIAARLRPQTDTIADLIKRWSDIRDAVRKGAH